MQYIIYRKISCAKIKIILIGKKCRAVSRHGPTFMITKINWFYFFTLKPNMIDTQPLAGVSPGWLNDETFTISFSC